MAHLQRDENTRSKPRQVRDDIQGYMHAIEELWLYAGEGR